MAEYEWLGEAIDSARTKVESLGLKFEVILNAAATATDIARCESEVGLEIQPSLRDLLLVHDGLTIRVVFSIPFADRAPVFFDVSLSVMGTSGISERTKSWRALHSATRANRDEWRRLIYVAEESGEGQFVVADTRVLLPGAEYPLCTWPIDDVPVARDLEEFLRKALHALALGRMMTFWVDEPLDAQR